MEVEALLSASRDAAVTHVVTAGDPLQSLTG